MAQSDGQVLKILIADRVAQEGIDLLRTQLPGAQIDERPGLKPEQLKAIIGDYAALVVRSETKVTSEILDAATQMKIVGRAGVGVDNIDTEVATRHGIIVVNSPTGNIVAAAEHSIAMLMALARHIPGANASMKAGKWEKSRFLGVEVRNKVLGIIGLGKVGTEVARRAQGLEMQVIAFDPFVSPEQARKANVSMMSMDEVLQQAEGRGHDRESRDTGPKSVLRGTPTGPSCRSILNCGMMSEFAIHTENLSRTYRRQRRRPWFRQKAADAPAEFTALDQVHLEVRLGSLYLSPIHT